MDSKAALSLDWSAIVGSGFVVAVLFAALVERLRRTFATQQELTAVREEFATLRSLCLRMRESADEARERARAAQAEQKHQWERIAEQVIRPVERTTERLEAVCEAQAAQATALNYITKRLDQADACRATPRHSFAGKDG